MNRSLRNRILEAETLFFSAAAAATGDPMFLLVAGLALFARLALGLADAYEDRH